MYFSTVHNFCLKIVLAILGGISKILIWYIMQFKLPISNNANLTFVFRYVVEPYIKYPNLLEVLLNFLKNEQSPGIRKEVKKVTVFGYF